MKSFPKIWDVPIRIWHWLFAIALGTALVTGYFSELALPIVHGIAGSTVFSLLTFRILWGFVGGIHVRWTAYRTTPKQVLDHFKPRSELRTHSAPGVLLVLVLMLTALVQATTGLFTSDDIFFEGPFHRFAEESTTDFSRWVHLRNWWIIGTLIAVHVFANLYYLIVLRNPLPLSMLHGKKSVNAVATQEYPLRAILCLLASGVVFAILYHYLD